MEMSTKLIITMMVSDQVDIVISDPIYPVLSIEGVESSIDSVTKSPDFPESGKDYSVTADLSCVEGQFLSVSITRDGYSLTTSSVYSNAANGSISVGIPGQPAGVLDEVVPICPALRNLKIGKENGGQQSNKLESISKIGSRCKIKADGHF
jgi:hypothetical protein